MTRIDGKQGGSRFAEFAKARFGMDKADASRWVSVGEQHRELLANVQHFSSDYRAFYEFTRLEVVL